MTQLSDLVSSYTNPSDLNNVNNDNLKVFAPQLSSSQLNNSNFTKLITIYFYLTIDKIADLNDTALSKIVNGLNIDDLYQFVMVKVLNPIYNFHLDILEFDDNGKNIKLSTLKFGDQLSDLYSKFIDLLTIQDSIESYYHQCTRIFLLFFQVAQNNKLYSSFIDLLKSIKALMYIIAEYNYFFSLYNLSKYHNNLFNTMSSLLTLVSSDVNTDINTIQGLEYAISKSIKHFKNIINNNANNIDFNDHGQKQKRLDIQFAFMNYCVKRLSEEKYNTTTNSPADNWTFPTDSKYNNKRAYTWNTDGTFMVNFDNTSTGYFQDRQIMYNMLQISYNIATYQYISKYQADPTLTTYDDNNFYNPTYSTITGIFTSKKDIIGDIILKYQNMINALNPNNQTIPNLDHSTKFNKYNTLINNLLTKINSKTA